MIAGTMTIASAWDGGMVTASRPMDTVGSPSPITPLTKPANRNAAAIRINRGSNMPNTLTDRHQRHNQRFAGQTFGNDGMFRMRKQCRSAKTELAGEQLHRRLMHARIACGNDAAAALGGLAFPSGDDA